MSAIDFTKQPFTDAHCLSLGQGLKASVFKVVLDDQQVILKDFCRAPVYLKPVVKILMRREVCVLEYLQGSPHVPALVKVIDPYRFVMEYIEGAHPGKAHHRPHSGLYQQAMNFLLAMHKAGVIHNDLRRKNLILHPERGLVFIDFGAALLMPRCLGEKRLSGFSLFCWLTTKLQLADRYHLIRLKPHLSCEPSTEQELNVLQRCRPFRRATLVWKLLFRDKKLSCGSTRGLGPLTTRPPSPMRWESDQNARQKHG